MDLGLIQRRVARYHTHLVIGQHRYAPTSQLRVVPLAALRASYLTWYLASGTSPNTKPATVPLVKEADALVRGDA